MRVNPMMMMVMVMMMMMMMIMRRFIMISTMVAWLGYCIKTVISLGRPKISSLHLAYSIVFLGVVLSWGANLYKTF